MQFENSNGKFVVSWWEDWANAQSSHNFDSIDAAKAAYNQLKDLPNVLQISLSYRLWHQVNREYV